VVEKKAREIYEKIKRVKGKGLWTRIGEEYQTAGVRGSVLRDGLLGGWERAGGCELWRDVHKL
jgi:hypothetical protein